MSSEASPDPIRPFDSPNSPDSPIKSGWRGNIGGYVEGCDTTQIVVSEVTLKLDARTAFALCNTLYDSVLNESRAIDSSQRQQLSILGAALGRLIDHPAANNGGRSIIK